MSRDKWEPMSEIGPYLGAGVYVWLLYDLPAGAQPVLGAHRKGMFWGKETEGWWGVERIGDFGRPANGMWIEGWIKGWKRYCDYSPAQGIEARSAMAVGHGPKDESPVAESDAPNG